MALCYRIPVCDRFGMHQATKWGETPEEALALLKESRKNKPGMGEADYGKPVVIDPQPFGFVPPRPGEFGAYMPPDESRGGASAEPEELVLA